jgi:hypothetical protein
MSFTDRTTIRKHLISSVTPERSITGLPITLDGQESLALPDANLLEFSETVKLIKKIGPITDGPISMIGVKVLNLSYGKLVPDKVAVALSDSFSTVYVEEVDYRIDYNKGTIQRLASGSIPDSQPVYVYYEFYDTYTRTTDYTMDYDDGTIVRTAGSAIPDGATVLIDYTVPEGSLEDSMIELAIVEAEDIIVRCLSSEYSESSTDQGLETGASQLALSIIARSLGAEALIGNRSSDAPSRSREWQKLSEFWEAKGWETLAPFIDPNSVRSPVVQ